MQRPNWKLVATFYAVAFGWVVLVAAGMYALGARTFVGGKVQIVFQLGVAFLYMPAPMVAALITERLAGRGYRMRTLFSGFARTLPRLVVSSVIVGAGVFIADFVLTWVLGNALGVGGVGTVVLTPEGFAANVAEVFGPAAEASMTGQGTPPPLVLAGLILVGGLTAGFSVNGLFAFGEEYGWRGWLMDELQPLGAVRANLATGAMWGLWHTPLILLGFNYAPHNAIGPLFMAVLCVPFSFLLWRSREYTGTVFGPCVLHGVFNGYAGAFLFLVADRNPLVAAPAGLIGAASVGIVAAGFWWATAGRIRPAEGVPVA